MLRKLKGGHSYERIQADSFPYAVSYNYLAENKGFTEYSGQIMDMLLRQTPQIKLMIINKLSESLMEAIPTDAPAQNTVETDIKAMEEKRKYYQRKYNLSEDLSKLIGIVPASSVNEDWKQAKEDYLREKYGV